MQLCVVECVQLCCNFVRMCKWVNSTCLFLSAFSNVFMSSVCICVCVCVSVHYFEVSFEVMLQAPHRKKRFCISRVFSSHPYAKHAQFVSSPRVLVYCSHIPDMWRTWNLSFVETLLFPFLLAEKRVILSCHWQFDPLVFGRSFGHGSIIRISSQMGLQAWMKKGIRSGGMLKQAREQKYLNAERHIQVKRSFYHH